MNECCYFGPAAAAAIHGQKAFTVQGQHSTTEESSTSYKRTEAKAKASSQPTLKLTFFHSVDSGDGH